MRLNVLSVGYSLARVSEHTAGGAEQILLSLDKALTHSGHRSLVLAPVGSKCNGLLLPVQIPSGTLDESAKCEARRLFRHALVRALQQYSPDVVHMHGIDFFDYLPEVPIPVIVTLHLPLSWYQPEALCLSRPSTFLIGVSESQARTAPRRTNIDRVIQNGVNLENFHPARKCGDYVLLMGRICPEKGTHLAMDAASEACTKLVIAGSVFAYPEHQSYFESMVRPRLGPDAVFVGAIGGMHKADLLASAKCLLIPSTAPETSSLIAMEALASGTPVIAMRSGALSEIIEEHKTGFLVRSASEMADAIKQVHVISPEACRQEAEARFSARGMVTQYLDLYRAVAVGKHLPELQAA
jgi:glycosyltransferase involved in cell wall biosynthesis